MNMKILKNGIAGLITALLVSGIYGCDSNQINPQTGSAPTPQKKMTPILPSHATLSTICEPYDSSNSKASNIFTCTKFASLRMSTANRDLALYFQSSQARKDLNQALNPNDRAFVDSDFGLRLDSKGNIKTNWIEVVVFYDEDPSNVAMFSALEDAIRSKDSASELQYLDAHFTEREVNLTLSTTGFFRPSSPQDDEFLNDQVSVGGKDKLVYWVKQKSLLEGLEGSSDYQQWGKLLSDFYKDDTYAEKLQWNKVQSVSSQLSLLRIFFGYQWNTLMPNDQTWGSDTYSGTHWANGDWTVEWVKP